MKKYLYYLLSPIFWAFSSSKLRAAGTDATHPLTSGASANLSILEDQLNLNQTQTMRPEDIIANIIQIFLTILGIIFIILMIYGGYLWMTARGNEETVSKAQQLFRDSIIGIIIVFFAYLITAFVLQRLGAAVFNPFWAAPY